MKNITSKILLLSTILFSLCSCYRVQPNAGQESVLVYKPYFFGHGGVDDTPISAGATWCVMTTDHAEFSIVPSNIEEDFSVVMSKDNTPLEMMVNIQVQAIKGQTPELYKKFGIDWYKNNVAPYFRTACRDEVSKYELFELTSKRGTSTTIEQILLIKMQDYVKKNNIPVNILQIAMAAITPPNEVLEETKKTAAQNQAILTQKSRADAELSRKQAEVNKAIADKAYQLQMGMTVSEYLNLRHLEIEKEKVELIKDNKNISIIFGNASPVIPIK